MPTEVSRDSQTTAAGAIQRVDRAMMQTVLELQREYYMLYGSWPSAAWVAQQLGLA